MNLLEIVKRLEKMSADYGSFPEGDALQSSVNRLAAELKRAGEDGACSDQFLVDYGVNDHCSYFESTIGSICGTCCA